MVYRGPQSLPWRIWGGFARFMLSRGVQTALQLATGTFFVSLFTLVTPLRFNLSCLASIFFLAAELVVAQDQHVGSHLFAGTALMGQLLGGIIWAAMMVMLAHAPGVAYTTFLCLFGCLGFLPIAMLRAHMGAPALGVNLGYGFTIVNAQFAWGGASVLWTQVIVPSIYLALVATAGCWVAGLCMLSTLARDELRDVVSDTLEQVGVCISGYASHMLMPPEVSRRMSMMAALQDDGSSQPPSGGPPEKTGLSPIGVAPLGATSQSPSCAFFETPGIREYQQALWEATDPGRQHGPRVRAGYGLVSVTSLLPRIQLARRLLVEAMAEPPLLSRKRIQLPKWGAALSALETLVLRVGSLESVLGSESPALNGPRLKEILGVDMLPTLTVLMAEIAACCSSLAASMRQRRGLQRLDQYGRLFEASFPALEAQLSSALKTALADSGFWTRYMDAWTEDPTDPPLIHVRLMMYVATLTNEIMRAMAAAEAAWEAAAVHQTEVWWPLPHLTRHQYKYTRDPKGKAAREVAAAGAVDEALKQASIKKGAPDGAAAEAPDLEAGNGSREQRTEDGAAAAELRPAALSALGGGRSPPSPNGAAAEPPAPVAGGGSRQRRTSVAAEEELHPAALSAFAGGRSKSMSIPRKSADPPPSPKFMRYFQEATDTVDSRRSLDATEDSHDGSEEPWRWNRIWTYNEISWVLFLVPLAFGMNVLQAGLAIIRKSTQVCRSPSGIYRNLRTNRKLQYFFKYYAVCCGCLIVILPLSNNFIAIRGWSPLYLLFTAIVVLSERVETTVQKSFFRWMGTVIGGTVGYLTMKWPESSTSPYIIMAVNCCWVGIAAFIALKAAWRYGVFLMLSTTLALTLCQYKPNLPGHTGTELYYYSRFVTIGIGLLVVVAVDVLIVPWYTSEFAMETLGEAFEDACGVLCDFHRIMQHQMSVPACGEQATEEPEIAGRERKVLEERIGRRLADVQVLLSKEVVLWRHGFLAMPQVVLDLQRCLSTLLLRMTAVEATLLQKPLLTGRYTASPHRYLVRPLAEVFQDIFAASMEVGRSTRILLSGDEKGSVPEQLEDADAAMRELVKARLRLRALYLETLKEYHAAIRAGKADDRSPDDSVRWLSYAFSVSEAIDRVMLFANTARTNQFIVDRCSKAVSDVKLRSWIGLKPRNHAASVDRANVSNGYSHPGAADRKITSMDAKL